MATVESLGIGAAPADITKAPGLPLPPGNKQSYPLTQFSEGKLELSPRLKEFQMHISLNEYCTLTVPQATNVCPSHNA